MDILRRFKKSGNNDSTSASARDVQPDVQSTPSQQPITVREVTPTEAFEQVQAGNAILLDVRQAWDHEGQHPAGSVSLPVNQLPERFEELDPKQHYILSCYHGFSSQDGAAFLMNLGFEQIESMSGGFSGWAQAGLPIEGKYSA